MADDPVKPPVALDLRNPVVHAAVASILGQGKLTVTTDQEQAVLLITDLSTESRTAPVLVLGTDMPWPIHPRLLLARVFALLDRRPQRLGRWLFDTRTRTLRDDAGRMVVLTTKEAEILGTLLEAGEPVSRDKLLSLVWGYEEGLDTHTLETHIYRLRRKLDDEDAKLLLTDARGGYALSPGVS